MIKSDLHVHTNVSFDGHDSAEAMIKAAIGRGLSDLAFTDHADFLPAYGPLPDFAALRHEVGRLRDAYGGKINITLGVEIGLGPRWTADIENLLASGGFGFVIGSTHDLDCGDIYNEEFYKHRDKKSAYSAFFEHTLASAAQFRHIDVLGHIDYIERYGAMFGKYGDASLEYADYREQIDEILTLLVRAGKGIEINASGYRYNLGRPHPRIEIVRRFREFGGEIVTIGSDAHYAEHVGGWFDESVELLRAARFRAFTVYRDGKPVFIDI